MILAGHYSAGLWTRQVVQMYFIALPILIAAFIVGNLLHRILHGERFHKALHILLLLMGATLIVKSIV